MRRNGGGEFFERGGLELHDRELLAGKGERYEVTKQKTKKRSHNFIYVKIWNPTRRISWRLDGAVFLLVCWAVGNYMISAKANHVNSRGAERESAFGHTCNESHLFIDGGNSDMTGQSARLLFLPVTRPLGKEIK